MLRQPDPEGFSTIHKGSPMTEKMNARSILIVDDEMSWLQTLRLAFKARGYSAVETCQESTQVLELLRSKHYDLLLLDLVMPKLAGAELLPRIRDEFPELQVIVLSGLMQTSDIDWCRALGVFGQCIKTDPQEELFAMVEQALSDNGDR